MTQSRARYYLALIVSLLTLVVFLPALRDGFVIWDDEKFIVNNLRIRSLDAASFTWAVTDLSFSLWQPAAWMSHAVDYAVWGLDPAGHHLTGIVLHALNTFLVVCLVVRLLEEPAAAAFRHRSRGAAGRTSSLVAAGVTGVLFGLHPQHVEPAVWLSGRTDPLCAFFLLLGLASYVQYASSRTDPQAGKRLTAIIVNRWYALSFILFVLALSAKPVAVVLPAVFLLLDWYPLGRFREGKGGASLFIEKIPFLAAGIAVSVVTVLAHTSQGMMATLSDMPVTSRLLLASRALFLYLWKMACPVDLLPLYPFPEHAALFSMGTFAMLGGEIAVTAFAVAVMRRRPLFPALWAYFLITMLPSLAAFGGRNSYMADRYTYLPSLGPFLLAGLGAAYAWGTAEKRQTLRYSRLFLGGVFGILCIILAALTVRQIGIWKDSVSLWGHVIEREPDRVPVAYNNRGMAFRERGESGRAIEDYARAIGLRPDAKPFTNRGIVYAETGQVDRAMQDFNAAISLDPAYADAYISRGLLLVRTGDPRKALPDLDAAVRLTPDSSDAFLNRGVAFEQLSDFGRAAEDYGRAIGINPYDHTAYNNRGAVLAHMGRLREAVDDHTRAIALKPDFDKAYVDRGDCYRSMGAAGPALADYRRACGLGNQQGCRSAEAFERLGAN